MSGWNAPDHLLQWLCSVLSGQQHQRLSILTCPVMTAAIDSETSLTTAPALYKALPASTRMCIAYLHKCIMAKTCIMATSCASCYKHSCCCSRKKGRFICVPQPLLVGSYILPEKTGKCFNPLTAKTVKEVLHFARQLWSNFPTSSTATLLCSVQGWHTAVKPVFEVVSLERKALGASVPLPKTVIRYILSAVLPRVLQRKLLGLLPQELGQYMLDAGQAGRLAGHFSPAC